MSFHAKDQKVNVLLLFSLISLLFYVYPVCARAVEFIDRAKMTIENSPEYNIALKEIKIARSDKRASLSGYLPQLTGKVEGGANHEDHQNINRDNYGELSGTLSLSQEIFNLKTIYEIEGAEQEIDVAQATLFQVEQDVLLEFSSYWGGYWKAIENMEVNQKNVRILQKYLDGAQTRYAAGELTLTDVSLAESRLLTSMTQRAHFSREVKRTRQLLEERIGDEVFPDEVKLFFVSIGEMVLPEQEEAIKNHPSMIPLVKELAVLNTNVDEQRSAHSPTLKTVARYKYQTDGENDVDGYPYNEGYVGLEFNIPIYTGGRVVSQTASALSSAQRQNLKIEHQRRTLVRKIQTAKYDYEYSAEEYELALKRLKSSEEALRWMVEENLAGTRSTVDVILAQSDMIDARLEVVRAREQQFQFLFSYLHSLGLLDINTLIKYQKV